MQTSAYRIRRAIARAFIALGVVLAVVFAGFPLYWMFVTSTRTSAERFTSDPVFLPDLGNLGNYFALFTETSMVDWLSNSLFIAFGVTVLSLAMAILAGYALSRFRFRGKGIAAFALFVTQMLPEALLIVPLYALFLGAGLMNSLIAVVLIQTAFVMPVSTWIIKGAMDSVPYEIEESATMDGVPRLGILWTIVLPLVAPSVAAASVIAFFDGWNEFLVSRTFLSSPSLWPASVGLSSFIGEYRTPLDLVMSAAVVYALPAIIFFWLVQRWIVTGLTAGAVKG
jgi:ABC-type sugar transport system, permease component